ncbi:transporter [Georgenia satyanarayanai]|uniref:aspartate-alanine antiporter-like transporter n=1 Tax=Georgenia satyanarayanai TaxID=860221 RepID=UPI0020411943|nr:TrkA C-terminal domain-containing protein [Georgenia satyanarayanai]MCM3662456.1 transporter [Georgenia satyanarayanai]
MIDLLAANPLLTIMVVVAAGTLLGMMPFGPVRFGAAGALFVGLAVGASDPRLGEGFGLLQTLGLVLFVYMVGLAAGGRFFRDLRTQLPMLAAAAGVLAVVAGAAVVLGRVLDVPPGMVGGAFAGSLTATPALAAAATATGTQEPAIGYSLAYPLGVVVTIVMVAVVLSRPWTSERDPQPRAGIGLVDVSAEVLHPLSLHEIPGYLEGTVRLSYLERDGQMGVVEEDEELREGDRVVVVGGRRAVHDAVDHLGRRVHRHLAHDRSVVHFRRFVVSDRQVAGRTVHELDIPGRFDGVVTRVRRGDTDLLAHEDLVLQLGDRVRVVFPRGQLTAISELFGDSERRVSEIDPLSLGTGVAVGLLLGLLTLPLPGGVAFALGSAAGPLVVGMVLGRLDRTGPVVWTLPSSANRTIRQLGLLLFLGATGLASGQAFVAQAFTGLGLRVVVAGVVLTALAGAGFVLVARLLGQSTARTAGGLAGFVGQPAILAYASSRVSDERVEAGYAALFAVGMIAKILLVQVVVTL